MNIPSRIKLLAGFLVTSSCTVPTFGGIYLFVQGILHITETLGFLSVLVSLVLTAIGLALTHEVGERLIEAYQTLRRGKK